MVRSAASPTQRDSSGHKSNRPRQRRATDPRRRVDPRRRARAHSARAGAPHRFAGILRRPLPRGTTDTRPAADVPECIRIGASTVCSSSRPHGPPRRRAPSRRGRTHRRHMFGLRRASPERSAKCAVGKTRLATRDRARPSEDRPSWTEAQCTLRPHAMARAPRAASNRDRSVGVVPRRHRTRNRGFSRSRARPRRTPRAPCGRCRQSTGRRPPRGLAHVPKASHPPPRRPRPLSLRHEFPRRAREHEIYFFRIGARGVYTVAPGYREDRQPVQRLNCPAPHDEDEPP